nr:MAG TPA: hypothetical protein [Caudoviricetes sp.]
MRLLKVSLIKTKWIMRTTAKETQMVRYMA